MFIVWRRKLIRSNRATELFTQYGMFPIYKRGKSVGIKLRKLRKATARDRCNPFFCRHTGDGRIAWTPLLMQSKRIHGKPRQKLLLRLPTIRSCCIRDQFLRAAWWHEVELMLHYFGSGRKPGAQYLQRDIRAILANLQEVVPRPTKAGQRAFHEYREAINEESKRAAAAERNRCEEMLRRQREEAERRQREEAERRQREEAERRRAEEYWRKWREEFARRRFPFNGPQQNACWSILGLDPDVTEEQLKARHRQLVMEYHPDRGGDPEKFKRVHAAYEEACRLIHER